MSCKNDGTKAKLAFSTIEPNTTQKKSLLVPDVQFDSAFMLLDNISLQKKLLEDFETIEDSLEYYDALEKTSASFYGPYTIHLLEETSSPAIDIIEVEPGLYSRLETSMANGTGDSTCFYLSGTAADDPERISFEFKYVSGTTFVLNNPSGFVIEESRVNVVWVSIDLNKLFTGVDLGAADEDADGVVRINTDSNADLTDRIIQNLHAASKLGLDLNMDRIIDD